MKPEYWVLSLSGGKDSTALGLEWLKRHIIDSVTYPLHEVIYCDTWMEFPAMVEHINRLEKIFTDAGIKFTRLKSEKSFEWWMFEWEGNKRDGSNLKGKQWPTARIRWCTGEMKQKVIARYFKELQSHYTVVQLIGLAADEEYRLHRANNQDSTHKHPLAEWGWTEAYCLQYCYDHGFDWGGLYEIFHRVSCWCCPLQRIDDLRKLRKHFPELWAKLREMQKRTWNTFKDRWPMEHLEIRFAFEEERLAAGLPINTREFHRELRKKIQEVKEA